MSDEKKRLQKSWGLLGPMPQSVINGGRDLVSKWKDLAIDAKRVSQMRWDSSTEEKAKKIEERYRELVRLAEFREINRGQNA